jgi:hypothetical protein
VIQSQAEGLLTDLGWVALRHGDHLPQTRKRPPTPNGSTHDLMAVRIMQHGGALSAGLMTR